MKGKAAVKRADHREIAVMPKYEAPEAGKDREKAVVTEMERREKTEGEKR